MSQFEQQARVALTAAQGQFDIDPGRETAPSLSPPQPAPQFYGSRQDSFKKAPTTPNMIRPIIAWRRLCARTGGGIALGTFYRWIRSGRVYTVRLGARVFVPLTTLDELIERCLSGEEL